MSSDQLAKGIARMHTTIEHKKEIRAVLLEQVEAWRNLVEDARLRNLMTETPLSGTDLKEASRHQLIAEDELIRVGAELKVLIEQRDRMLREWVPGVKV
jgi:hypothetical protein